jgi:uncharacterized membrane protein
MNNEKPKSVSELRSLRTPIRNVNIEQKENLSKLNRLAVRITEKVGTMGFFITIFLWTVLWLGWNILAPEQYRFDPVPACVFWLFLSNMIQIFLMPLLMIGQNLQSKHAEARAESDFEINTKAELEIETVLLHLQEQYNVLQEQNSVLSDQNKTLSEENKNILEILNRLDKK